MEMLFQPNGNSVCSIIWHQIWKWGTLYWAICFLWENARTFCIITLLNINTSFMRHKKFLCENKRWNASSREAHLVGRVGSWVISHSALAGPGSPGLMRSSNAQCLVCTSQQAVWMFEAATNLGINHLSGSQYDSWVTYCPTLNM